MTVEVTTRYCTTVPTLADAWGFVMTHIDTVGAHPSVNIRPVWILNDDGDETRFEVMVEGMVEQ